MALTVLCAGCSSAERERAEAEVRAALGRRAVDEAWRVSLVKIGERWSVTLDGPGHSARSFVAEAVGLGASLSEALGGRARGSAPARGPAAEAASVVRDRHHCVACKRPFEIRYETVPDEPQEIVAIACPYCWASNPVLVGEAAAYTQAFLAEKLEP